MIGKTAKDESDISAGERGRDIGDALIEKTVVAQVGVWIKRHRREKYNHRLAQGVGRGHGRIERGIVDAALGALHPVDDTGSVGVGRAGAANGNARILRESGQVIH